MKKRSISIDGHRTSIALEPVFWTWLERFTTADKITLPRLIGKIDRLRITGQPPQGLASSLRVYVIERIEREFLSGGDDA